VIGRLAAMPVFVQVAALVLATILAAQAIGFAIVVYAPPPRPAALSISAVLDFIASDVESDSGLSRSVRSAPPFEMKPGSTTSPQTLIARAISEALGVPRDQVRIQMIDPYGLRAPGESPTTTQGGVAIIQGLSTENGPSAPGRPRLGDLLRSMSVTFPPFTTAIRRDDGTWLVITPRNGGLAAWQSLVLLWFILAAALLAPLAWIIARMLTHPIRAFAQGVERFGQDPAAEPLEERGPREVRSAIQSFNRMQASLKAYVDERSAMVAAIAHDLRTPLTSLRFRAEAAPEITRDRMVEDIERMKAMASQVMAFVRGEQKRETRELLSFSNLAEACSMEAKESGGNVTCAIEPDLMVSAEPVNLRRALSNLVENAIKFGGAAHVSVWQSAGRANFQVDDDGPGMPEHELEKAFEPFHRVEPSRSRRTGGMGLGLALVRAVVQAHGGEVTLRNRLHGGLSAQISLHLARKSSVAAT
jgi:signal transduction histidine kinase